jgi:hypothetical protein
MRKVLATALALLLVTATVAYGQQEGDTPPTDLSKVGTSAANFLKLPVGARSLALGGGGVATVRDATALYWNPAGIGGIDRVTLAYNRFDLYAGITHTFTGLVMPLGLNTRVGVSYIGLNSGEMEITTVEDPGGTGEFFEVVNTAIGVTFSQILTDRFTLGITGKWIQEKIQRAVANGIALDVGSSFNTGLLGTRLGMAILNMGPKMKLDGPDLAFDRQINVEPGELTAGLNPEANLKTLDYDLPLMFRLGVSIDLLGGISTFMTNDMNRVTALIDIEDANDQVARVGVSLEYAWNEVVYARLGYRIKSQLSDQLGARLAGLDREAFELGYGLGLNTTVSGYAIQLDYGLADYGDLGTVNQFFLSLGF